MRELARNELEGWIRPLAASTRESIECAISDARIGRERIEKVILVGGSTHIPLVWNVIEEALGRLPHAGVAPALAVALGAAVQAGIIAGGPAEMILMDVAAHSPGVEVREESEGIQIPFAFSHIIAASLAATLGLAVLLAGVWYVWSGKRGVQPAAEEERPGARAAVQCAVTAAAVREPTTVPPLTDGAFARLYREELDLALRGEIAEARARFQTLAGEEHAGRRLAGNVHSWPGRCLAQSRETEAALREFWRVIGRYPESPKRGHALLDAGRRWLRLGRRDQAGEALRELPAGDHEPALQELARKFVQR